MFGEEHNDDEKVQFFHNEFFLNHQDGAVEERITDSHFVINNVKYHMECQSSPDGTMAVRMFEYDTQIALEDGEFKDNILSLEFPKSAVVYLRNTSKTPEHMLIRIRVPGDFCSYRIPAVKIQQYSIDTIFEKKLLFLIPFHIFCYEKNFKIYERDELLLEKLKEEYDRIMFQLDELLKKREITEYTMRTIIRMSKLVLENIARKYEKIEKKIGDVMGGKILEYEEKTILNQGRAIGLQEGRMEGRAVGLQEGRVETITNLFKSGLLPLAEAIKYLGCSEETFKTYL